MTAEIFNIQRFCVNDGPGIRTTVFFKGCNLRCAWCHNPESQSVSKQILFYSEKCTHCGRCKEWTVNNGDFFCSNGAKEICGKTVTVDNVMDEILKDREFYKNSSGGVTFSGGECMLQIDFLEELLKACKQNGIHTTVDTAGHVPYESFERIIPYTDLFLYDIKCYDSNKHQKYTGASNEQILSNLRKLLKTNKTVWVRIPIIPSVNDTEEEMLAIKSFLYSCRAPKKIELLPYHSMGEHKYASLGKAAQAFSIPSEEKMMQLKNIFS
jgi:pyruvate formate lyase activating enzyme